MNELSISKSNYRWFWSLFVVISSKILYCKIIVINKICLLFPRSQSKTQLRIAGFTNYYGKDNKVHILCEQQGVGVGHSIDGKC